MNGYKAVIGLEVHAQLMTRSKIFSSDSATYGANPNTQVSVVSLGHPGTLPVLNKTCVEFAIRMGLAVEAKITTVNYFARKNYFYADLPKGYQISQDQTPICRNGKVMIRKPDGTRKNIRIHRIHMEEDSGKSIHDQDPYHTLIDLNRAGVGLIEIVSEADIENSEEAMAYLGEIRKIVRYLEICDGNMEEGSLRCDANVSVMRTDAKEWGTKVEVKNMNSISNVGRAINYEIERQIKALESGIEIRQQTLTWDAGKGATVLMREKESAHDYRYFPEPDLPPLIISEKMIEAIQETLPQLPHVLYDWITKDLEVPDQDAVILTENKAFVNYFIQLTESGCKPRTAANWMLGSVRSWLNTQALPIESYPLTPAKLFELTELVEQGKVSNTIARDKLLTLMLSEPEASALALAKEHNLMLEEADDSLEETIKSILEKFPEKVEAFRTGKTGLLGFFVGQVMQATGGKMDPKIISHKVNEYLSPSSHV